MKSFDHIIVGTGQATGTLLGKLIPTGESIAVIEANRTVIRKPPNQMYGKRE